MPIGDDVFDGNRADVTTVEDIVEAMEERYGLAHAARFESTPALSNGSAIYKAPKSLSDNAWSLQGSWSVEPQFASANAAGILELNFDAKDVFMVIAPEPEGASGSTIARCYGA